MLQIVLYVLINIFILFIGYRLYQLLGYWKAVNPDYAEYSTYQNMTFFGKAVLKMMSSKNTAWMIITGSFFKMVEQLSNVSDEQLASMDLGIESLDNYLRNFFRPSIWDVFYDCGRYQWKYQDIYIAILNILDNQYKETLDGISYDELPDDFHARLVSTFGEPRWDKYTYPTHNYGDVCRTIVKFIDINLAEINKSNDKELLVSCFIGQILDSEKLSKELGSNFPSHVTIAMLIRHGVETP